MIKGELKGERLVMGHRPGGGIEPTFESIRDGCRYSSSCLTCPLPVCKHDSQPSRAHRGQGRALQMLDAGASSTEAAAAVGVTARAVLRWAQSRRAKA